MIFSGTHIFLQDSCIIIIISIEEHKKHQPNGLILMEIDYRGLLDFRIFQMALEI